MRQHTDEEIMLRQLTNAANPYCAPEGYFNEFPGKVMQQVKARQRRKLATRWTVAAVMAGCVATAGFTLLGMGMRNERQAELAHDKYIDDALDYSMIDNAEIAYYLTEAK